MAEEFRGGVCGGGWWNMSSSRGVLTGGSPCSTAITSNDMGWGLDVVEDMKATRSCDQNSNNNSASADSFQTSRQKPQQQQRQTDSDHSGGSSSTTSVLMDSTLQMMGFSLQSSSDWNPALLSTGVDTSVLDNFTGMNQEFSLDQQRLNSINTSISDCTTSCQGLSAGLIPVSATSSYPSTLIPSFFEQSDPQQQSFFNNGSMNYPNNYGTDLNDQFMAAAWTKLSANNNYLTTSSLPKQLQPTSLQFTNNTTFWNASSGTALKDKEAPGFFRPTQQAQFLGPKTIDEKKTNCSTLIAKVNTEEVRESVNKGTDIIPALKRPRIETPSPLPTFKVRKEKLGDRITALQQLVSPFGKTDTASVLYEAIDYIKLLHDQVNILSTPYMKNGRPIQLIQQSCDKLDSEGVKQDLKSRGLCLVPISSTFPVSNEANNADFWTPTFGGTFR